MAGSGFASATVVLALRVTQAVLAIIVLGLTGYVANWWHTNWYASSLSQVNFLVFTSVWTLLALVYLVVVPWRFSDTVAHHKFAILAAEAVTMLFWFAGFIALAVFLTDRVCYGIVCGAVIAGNVFAAFEWLLFVATTTMAVMHVVRTRRDSNNQKADPNINVQEGV